MIVTVSGRTKHLPCYKPLMIIVQFDRNQHNTGTSGQIAKNLCGKCPPEVNAVRSEIDSPVYNDIMSNVTENLDSI